MDGFKELTIFYHYSAKRKHILLDHLKSSKNPEDFLADCVEDEFFPKRKFQGLPVLSDTRWLTRFDSIHCLLLNYRAVCEAVEALRDSSTGKSASDDDSYLKRLLSFEFLVSVIIGRHVLAYTRPITVALHIPIEFNREFAATGSPRHPKHDVTYLINIPYIFWTCWERAIADIKREFADHLPYPSSFEGEVAT